jgi:hypothetical protein
MTSPTTTTDATKPNECIIDVHPNIFDLTGKLTVDFYNATNPTGPVTFVHEDQVLVVKVNVELGGRILQVRRDAYPALIPARGRRRNASGGDARSPSPRRRRSR